MILKMRCYRPILKVLPCVIVSVFLSYGSLPEITPSMFPGPLFPSNSVNAFNVSAVNPLLNSRHLQEHYSPKRNGSHEQNVFSNLFKIKTNVTDLDAFWRSVRDLVGHDSLYPKSYDVRQVTDVLRYGKIVKADLFLSQTSLKLKLRFEGLQTAIFKIMLIERENKTSKGLCNNGCEHPEYEVAAFTLNRMFDLRNMPYTTGRIISWYDEIEPVATKRLKKFAQIRQDMSVCFNWACYRSPLERYCFKNGMISGAVQYYIEDKVVETFYSDSSIYHGFYVLGATDFKELERLPGEKKFCEQFRNGTLYSADDWFLDLVDIAVFDYLFSHIDAKHTYLVQPGDNEKPEFNAMFDFGHAFCTHPYPDLTLLAPLTQCCRIRTRMFRAMEKYKHSFENTFLSLTNEDPLHPLLLRENMDDMIKRFRQSLALIDFCRHLDGDASVFVDV